MGKLRGLKASFDDFVPGWASPPAGYIGRSSSGEHVTWDSAMAISVIFRCVSLLGGTVAGLPLVTYRRVKDDCGLVTTERAYDRPEYDLLHDAPMPDPNQRMTSFIWRETAMSHLLLWGNSYSEIIRDPFLGLLGLKLLPPHRMVPRVINGQRIYDYRNPDGSNVRLTPREVLHIPGLGYDGFLGYSVIRLMREDIGLYQAAHSYGSNFFRNNARPSVVLQHPKTLPAAVQERLAVQMDRLRGSANSGKTIVLEDDMKFSTLGMSNEDAQYIQTKQFQVGELSRWFGAPPHMVGDVSGSTSWGTGIAEQSMGFLRFNVDNWLNRFEQEFKLQLFSGYPELRAEFVRAALLQLDTLKQFQAYRLAAGDAPWMTRNEIRAHESLNPIEGLDDIVLPVNVAPVTPDLLPGSVQTEPGMGKESQQ
jgi:HK97 family phage portal protein